VVTGQVQLEKRQQFMQAHSEVLLPMMRSAGIKPKLLLLTEIGRFCRFLDVYEYADLTEYEAKTDSLISNPGMKAYYEQVGECIEGGICVEIMKRLPYAEDWEGI